MSKSNFLKSILTVCFFVSVASAALAQNATSPISTGASREVKGTVFDVQEQPLMGVAVLLAGTTTGGGD